MGDMRTRGAVALAGAMALAGIGGAVTAQEEPIEVAYMSASSANVGSRRRSSRG